MSLLPNASPLIPTPVAHTHARRASARRVLWATVALLVLTAIPLSGQDPLAAARDLYASARYDEALALLDGLHEERPGLTSVERRAIDQYRSFCLLALGREAEADEAIGAIVMADPTFLPRAEETSPRVLAAFHEVRRRLLPAIAMQAFGEARRVYERQQHEEAAERFRYVLALLGDPDMQRQHADLRTLASAFLELSVEAAAPPPAPEEPPVPVTAQIFDAGNPAVIPPVTIRQDLPKLPSDLAELRGFGLLEVIVDGQGSVESASVTRSVHPSYDAALLEATRDWRYRPATVNDAPVKYRKLIQVRLDGR